MDWKDFSLKEKIYLIELICFSILSVMIFVLIVPLVALILSLLGIYIIIKRKKQYYGWLPFLILVNIVMDLFILIPVLLTTLV